MIIIHHHLIHNFRMCVLNFIETCCDHEFHEIQEIHEIHEILEIPHNVDKYF
jgi:hypothetical protein